MGNSTSQIRPPEARKSSASKQHGDLDEEFSDMILHEVKRKNEGKPQGRSDSKPPPNSSNQGILEDDEFNELNDLIDTEEPELSRNILPNNKDGDDMAVDEANEMQASNMMQGVQMAGFNPQTQTYPQTQNHLQPQSQTSRPPSQTPTPELSRVDVRRIMPQNYASQQRTPQAFRQPPTQARPESPVVHALSPAQFGLPMAVQLNAVIPVEIKWVNLSDQIIKKASIIGSFSNWRSTIRLKPCVQHPNEYVATVNLPLGVHRLLYIINNEYRVSEQLPTATDQEGIFFNWFEVLDELHLFNHAQNQPNRTNALTKYDANIITGPNGSKDEVNFEHVEFMDSTESEMNDLVQPVPMSPAVPYGISPGMEVDSRVSERDNDHDHHHEDPASYRDSRSWEHGQDSPTFMLHEPKLEYSSDIPEMFINYNYFKNQNANFELPEPPQLPAHLNNVLLNKISNTNLRPELIISGSSGNSMTGSMTGSVQGSFDTFKPPAAAFTEPPKRPQLRRADSSYYASNAEAYHLSIPNHVILNHLMTTLIRNDVLTVGCITRYSGKFVTQIMHSPAE